MSLPNPNSTLPPHAPKPPRLSFLTLPLMISLVFQAISLLTLPFSGGSLNETLAEAGKMMGQSLPPLTPEMINVVLWISFFITAALIMWLYNTYRAVLEGKSWGRISSMVIALFSLLIFPIGTLLGIVMLIGAFDQDVRAYTSRNSKRG